MRAFLIRYLRILRSIASKDVFGIGLRVLFDDIQFFADLDEGGDAAVELFGRVAVSYTHLPMLIMKYSRGDEKQIAVIDESGLVAPKLQSGEELVFQTTDLSTEAARKELTDKFGVLYIGSDILTNPNNVKLYVNSSSSLTVESNITGQLEEIIEAEKLKSYNIENLSQILQEVKTTVGMQTFRNDESQEEEPQAKSSVIATGVGFVLGMILYMFLLIYGSMVMQSVIEEKNSRVLEVMVSSVRPFDLMLGKILGVASVAVVQVLIWGVLCAVGAAAAVHMMPADVDVYKRQGALPYRRFGSARRERRADRLRGRNLDGFDHRRDVRRGLFARRDARDRCVGRGQGLGFGAHRPPLYSLLPADRAQSGVSERAYERGRRRQAVPGDEPALLDADRHGADGAFRAGDGSRQGRFRPPDGCLLYTSFRLLRLLRLKCCCPR